MSSSMSAVSEDRLMTALSDARAIELRFMFPYDSSGSGKPRHAAYFINDPENLERLLSMLKESKGALANLDRTVAAIPSCYLILYSDYLGTKSVDPAIEVQTHKNKPLLDALLKLCVEDARK
jgi:hypothetical protein